MSNKENLQSDLNLETTNNEPYDNDDSKWEDENLELRFNTSNRDHHRQKNKFSIKKIFNKKQKTKYDEENNNFSFKKPKNRSREKTWIFSKSKFFKKNNKSKN